MSLSVDGVWKTGVWATTVWADGVWREGPPLQPTPPAPATEQFSGGFDYPHDRRRRRSEEDIPPEAQAVIEAVAERQAEHPPADEQRRFEELERELTLRGLEWEVRYLVAMNKLREVLRARQRDERLLLLIAAAIT